ncbi:MAG: hypothetical protein ACI92E_001362 [Oceanicoccus sp.]|jgi:hypothetical protein
MTRPKIVTLLDYRFKKVLNRPHLRTNIAFLRGFVSNSIRQRWVSQAILYGKNISVFIIYHDIYFLYNKLTQIKFKPRKKIDFYA